MLKDILGLGCLVVGVLGLLAILVGAGLVGGWWVPCAAVVLSLCLVKGISYAVDVYDNSKEK